MSAAAALPGAVQSDAALPPRWWERYVGRAYAPGAFDCADLVETVAREVLGRDVRFPKDRAAGQRSEGYRAQIEAEWPRFFRRRAEVGSGTLDSGQTGDMVLLIGAGRANHIGVLVRCENEPWVLHNSIAARQVVFTRLTGLRSQGLAIEGVYAWI